MNRNIVFDTHIELEHKVMTYSKLHLLNKQHESEILILKNQNTYFVHIQDQKTCFDGTAHYHVEKTLHHYKLGHHLKLR